MTDDDGNFVDYYGVLQVDPHCDATILESAHHSLAKLYHPDRGGTSDAAKFNEVMQAYRVLRNPDDRAGYDVLYYQHYPEAQRANGHATGPDDYSAIGDADDHEKILTTLYKRRRENAREPGIGQFMLQEMVGCSNEHFDFLQWYLKEKGFIVMTEQGTLAITVQGVDHVISMTRTAKAEKLLIGQSTSPSE